MARVEYPPEIKAAAIAMLLAGASLRATAAQFNVSPSTVSDWRDHEAGVSVRNEIEQSVRLDVGRLVATYLDANFGALTAQARTFSDPEWIRSQTASDLIAAHNALADRAVHILGAIQPAPSDDGANGADPAAPAS